MSHGPGFLLTVLAFALVIGPLVFLHELGHYLAGRVFGVKADTFSIGFGREIAGFTDRRGTRWKFSWIPLGGYVKFAGDMNAASQPSDEWRSLPAAEREHTFPVKPVWQRAIIVAAGPITNFLVAIVILMGFALAYGDDRSIVGEVVPGSPAMSANLVPGDRLVAIDGAAVDSFDDLVALVAPRPGATVRLSYVHEETRYERTVRIARHEAPRRDGHGTVTIGQLGIGRAPVRLVDAPARGMEQVAHIVRMTASALGQVVVGQRSVKELGGPLKIAQVSGQVLAIGWIDLLFLIGLVSINLGFINLLPVPMLDGGHLLFYAIEAVQRRPVSADAQEWAFRGGLAAILGLMVLVTFNDLGALGLWRNLAGLIG